MKWLALPLLLVASVLRADDKDAKLFAVIFAPDTPEQARIDAVNELDGNLLPDNVERLMAEELKLRREAERDPKPWHADALQAIERIYSPAGYMPGIPLLRKMPCGSELEEQAMLRNLERFHMTPELYGVLRNIVLRHDGDLQTKREWFGWADYYREDNEIWWASQAFVAEFAPNADRVMLKRLTDIVVRMLGEGDNMPRAAIDRTPNTALLALLDRIDAVAEDPKTHCWLAQRASFLLYGYDLPKIPADAISFTHGMRDYPMWNPDTYEKVSECHAWIGTFRTWLAAQREKLDQAAAQERELIAKARARMVAEQLCR